MRYPCWTNIQTKHEGSIKYKARPQVDGLLFRVGVVGVGGGGIAQKADPTRANRETRIDLIRRLL